MYAPNFLDGYDRLVAFDAETTGKHTPSAEFVRKQPFAWKPPGVVIEVGFVEMLRDGEGWRKGATWRERVNPDAPIDLEFTTFESAVAQLARFGFPVERTAVEAWPHFKGWRVNYEALAYQFADYLIAPHTPWSGPRRHLSETIVLPDRPPHRNPNGDLTWDNQLREGS